MRTEDRELADVVAGAVDGALRHEDPGLAVGVVHGDSRACVCRGLRDREAALSVTVDTVFEIGSLTKTFTTGALLSAAAEQRVELDAPLNGARTLLRFGDPDVTRDVTLRDVLAHRTGLPANDLLWYLGSPSREALLGAIGALAVAPGAFRKTFTYNNLLYGALGLLFDDLVGERWEDAVQRRLLDPVGMSSTSFGPRASESDVAAPYVGGVRVRRVDAGSIAAAGAMRSTLSDMMRWLAMHLGSGERVLSSDVLTALRTPEIDIGSASPLLRLGLDWTGDPVRYALGWLVGSFESKTLFYHPGFIDGFSALIALVPEARTGVVVLSNTNLATLPGMLARSILGSLLAPTQAAAAPPVVAPDPAAAGEYVDGAYGSISLAVQDASSTLAYHGHVWPLTWRSTDLAELELSAAGATFPLPVHFLREGERVAEVRIPMSLDPRVPPIAFVRA